MSETITEGGQSNVFRVKDVTAFQNWCKKHHIQCLDVDNDNEWDKSKLAPVTPDMVCLLADEDWESLKHDCDMDDHDEFVRGYLLPGIAKFLKEGSVAILTEVFVAARKTTTGVGAMFYAVDHNGTQISASLDELAVRLAFVQLDHTEPLKEDEPRTLAPIFWPGQSTRMTVPEAPRPQNPGT